MRARIWRIGNHRIYAHWILRLFFIRSFLVIRIEKIVFLIICLNFQFSRLSIWSPFCIIRVSFFNTFCNEWSANFESAFIMCWRKLRIYFFLEWIYFLTKFIFWIIIFLFLVFSDFLFIFIKDFESRFVKFWFSIFLRVLICRISEFMEQRELILYVSSNFIFVNNLLFLLIIKNLFFFWWGLIKVSVLRSFFGWVRFQWQ